MLNVKVIDSSSTDYVHMNYVINSDAGSVFALYEDGKFTNEYMINMGSYSPVLYIWFNKESNTHNISIRSKNELLEELNYLMAKRIKAEININIEIKS